MINKLRLKNFKAWRDSEEIELAPVTMLLGTNSSGKSSLIQSLLLLKQTAASPDRTIHLNLGGDEVKDYFNFGDFDAVLTKGTSAPRQFVISLGFSRPQGERVPNAEFTCSYAQSSSGAVVIQELTLSSVARQFRAVRRSGGAYSLMVDDEGQPLWFVARERKLPDDEALAAG